MASALKNCWLWLLLTAPLFSAAQRKYADHSVLASGNWYKLAIPQSGVYKLDATQLQQAGISLPVNSSSIRLFGRSFYPAGEAVNSPYLDDLSEIRIDLQDGGDGQFSGADWLAFYAAGANGWQADTANKRFRAIHNIYTDTAFVFLQIGGEGAHVQNSSPAPGPAPVISTYQFRFHAEKDLYNLLSSGREWYGERFQSELSTTTRVSLPIPESGAGARAKLVSVLAARSVDQPASFSLSVNNSALMNQDIAAVSNSALDQFARESRMEADFTAGTVNELGVQFSSGATGALGWINYFDVFADCPISLKGLSQLDFRSWDNIGAGVPVQYRVQQASAATRVWRVTDPLNPVNMVGVTDNDQFSFTDDHERPEEYIAFSADPVSLPAAAFVGRVANQDLHGLPIPGMILLTIPELLPAANRLADWHRQQNGLQATIVTTSQVYQEFSGGQPDPTAIRDLVKMWYDRAGGDDNLRPKYLLLLGDASFDFRNRLPANTNQVPSYQSSESLDPLASYVTDDYFGFLDAGEDINHLEAGDQLDIGIGRIPAATLQSANDYVDKIILYHQPSTRGDWRNSLSFIADDEDFNLHLRDAEEITSRLKSVNNQFQVNKIYLDAYPQESDAAGSRYPAVNQAIGEDMQKGTLIWNYSGHGGYRRLAEEVVVDHDIADSWQQQGRLPLFITATCDFAPYDNPAISSLGEYLLLKPGSGAIALMTTTRLVFAFSNRIMNSNYLAKALEPLPGGGFRTLGEASRAAKNLTLQNAGDLVNTLKFTLLGDPAVTLAFPKYRVQTDSVNGKPVTSEADTIRAQKEVQVTGKITDGQGQLRPDFNGTVNIQVMDKPYARKTLGNDPGSLAEEFMVQDQFLYRGKATVRGGKFSFSFVVPRDISYTAGLAAIRYYAMDSLTDAQGFFDRLPIGGSVTGPVDNQGPAIGAWLNDRQFRDGGLTGEKPLLLVDLADSSGINVLGNGIGHDITVIIDGDSRNPLVLNAFFETENDTYRRGGLQFRLPEMPDGNHNLTIKAWDVLNNSSETTLRFTVKNSRRLVVESAIAWPNPSAGEVRFGVSHNRGNEPLQALVELFLINGQLVKRIPGTIIGSGNRSYIAWNGRDDRGNLVSPGIYFYRMIITSTDGQQAVVVKRMIRR